MKEFIIGKEGTQKFLIQLTKTRVSRQHARITIDDNGVWTLEDLNSTNGTFIIDDEGELRQIRRMVIGEFTRIVLADQTQMGFSFIAHHVIEDDPNDYRVEFRHVLEIHQKALLDKAAMDLRLKRRGYIKYVPSMLAACIGLILTLFLPSEIKVYGVSVTAVFTTILTAVINIFQGNDKSKQRFSDYYGKFLVCPHCGKILTEKEFQMQMCAVCKAHS